MVGGTVGLAASAAISLTSVAALTTIAVLALVVVLADLAGKTPMIRRQTKPLWWHTMGPFRAVAFWGFDLGLGVTTIRMASLYWVVLAGVALLLPSPIVAAAVMTAYGAGLTVNLVVGSLLIDRKHRGQRANIRAIRLGRLVRPSLIAIEAGVGTACTLLAYNAI